MVYVNIIYVYIYFNVSKKGTKPWVKMSGVGGWDELFTRDRHACSLQGSL